MSAGLWHVRTPHRPNTTRAAAEERIAHAPQARCACAGGCQAISVVKPSSLAGYSLRGSGTAGTHCPTGFHPEWGRAALAIHGNAAIMLSALSMPFGRPNRCSASRSQLALGSYSWSSLPALLLPAPEQGRFPGRPMAARLLIGNAWNVWAPDHRRLVSTQAPESGHDQSTEKGGPCHRERHGKSRRKPGPRSALHGSRHKPKARRPMATPPRAAIAARLTGAEDLRFSCRLF